MHLEKVLEGFNSESPHISECVQSSNVSKKIRRLYPDFYHVTNEHLLNLGIHKNHLFRMYKSGVFGCNVKKVRFGKRSYLLTKDIKSLINQYVRNIKKKDHSPYRTELYRIVYAESNYSPKENKILLNELAELKKDFNRVYLAACKENGDLVGKMKIVDSSIKRSQCYILERFKEDRAVLDYSILEDLASRINDKVNKYVETNLKLVLYYFGDLYGKEETDDLFQEAYFIFRRAVINHDEFKGKVSAYFFSSLDRIIKSNEIKQRRLIRIPENNFFGNLSEESIDEKFRTKIRKNIFYECGFNGMLNDERGLDIKNPEPLFDVYSARKHISCLLQKYFSKREKEIFNLKLDGLCLREIGDEFGLTRERIRQICDKIQERLTNYIQKGKVLRRVIPNKFRS